MHIRRILILFVSFASASSLQNVLGEEDLTVNGVSFSTRAYWMRQANAALAALASPCPFGAFGSVIVNHTGNGDLGELVCMGVNSIEKTGNPTLHGEIAAINNCTDVLTNPSGPYNLSAAQAQAAFSQLSLYTNAESCPMCASAIRWAGFKEYIYGTSIKTLIAQGWGQIRVSSMDIFAQSFDLPYQGRLIGEVLANETDPYFLWQYNPSYPCPVGCQRPNQGASCMPFECDTDRDTYTADALIFMSSLESPHEE